MRHIRELKTKYQIRFADRRRFAESQASEVTYSFDKETFTQREVQALRDERSSRPSGRLRIERSSGSSSSAARSSSSRPPAARRHCRVSSRTISSAAR